MVRRIGEMGEKQNCKVQAAKFTEVSGGKIIFNWRQGREPGG